MVRYWITQAGIVSVMAENISDACDELDELGALEYEFVHAKSNEV